MTDAVSGRSSAPPGCSLCPTCRPNNADPHQSGGSSRAEAHRKAKRPALIGTTGRGPTGMITVTAKEGIPKTCLARGRKMYVQVPSARPSASQTPTTVPPGKITFASTPSRQVSVGRLDAGDAERRSKATPTEQMAARMVGPPATWLLARSRNSRTSPPILALDKLRAAVPPLPLAEAPDRQRGERAKQRAAGLLVVPYIAG